MSKKNCHNCTHLEWFDDDSEVNDQSGFGCNGRDYYKRGDSDENMNRHNDQLSDEKYREAPKKCSEPLKPQPPKENV